MTPTRFFFARVGQAFGIHRRNVRMGEAASEMHLLREAEAHLGAAIWEKVEGIEELSVEYWNLRRLQADRSGVAASLAECEEKLRTAHDQRAALLTAHAEPQQDLIDERAKVMANLESLTRKRDDVVAEARGVRRTYDGLKMKLEVLAKEAVDGKAPQEEVDKVRQRLAELKARFGELKSQRDSIGTDIEQNDARMTEIDMRLDEAKQARRMQASEAFQVIGDVNKQISTLRAELGLLETQMRQLQSEIGRHVSRNSHDPNYADAIRDHRGLVDVMHALRHSIVLNHRLAGMA